MLDKKQLITIKGTRDGLTLFIDEVCSYDLVVNELHATIAESSPKENEPVVSVKVQLGNRFLTEQQKKELTDIITKDHRFIVESIESSVIRREEALRWKEHSDIQAVSRVIRSGQVLEVTGDLLLIGDVNPGGKVVATGNIYIMGNLHGIAHAGSIGDRQAFIAASFMKPNQLRIADYISRAPDYEADGVYMECGLVDEEQDKIVIDRLQVLSHNRQVLSGFERRMQNG
ncbi:septum site-determining protein MinC [Virgibacillus halodenitrificans]|uniref:septum site-determining protein MinC n=1 Tax=Virgibacillus halodenitrificans TaxID=1482 RepID=UPI00136CD69C|nr:septum site-determining protein MinC [Virgibacillus halodenitrificans]MYL44907.1 septum site-determining protein MinC [Virgibacillus halodenitrificans]